ncbi:MAG: hypothetical protein ACI89X_000130 [Planctomycetota bacterium]|jgi:hypothetical protein
MFRTKLVSGVCVFLMALVAMGGDAVAQKKTKAKPVMSAVVLVGGDYQIVGKDEVAKLKKKLTRDHKNALAAHKAAKADAKKNKEKFALPAPKAQKLKVVKASIEQSKAEALVAQLKEKDAKKSAPKERPAKKTPAKKAKGKKSK